MLVCPIRLTDTPGLLIVAGCLATPAFGLGIVPPGLQIILQSSLMLPSLRLQKFSTISMPCSSTTAVNASIVSPKQLKVLRICAFIAIVEMVCTPLSYMLELGLQLCVIKDATKRGKQRFQKDYTKKRSDSSCRE